MDKPPAPKREASDWVRWYGSFGLTATVPVGWTGLGPYRKVKWLWLTRPGPSPAKPWLLRRVWTSLRSHRMVKLLDSGLVPAEP